MKTTVFPNPLISWLAAVCFTLTTLSAIGQAPIISSFSQNGQLVCTNLQPGSTASVEWASSALGPWTNNWAALESVTVDSNGLIRVSVPMFYRVRGVAAPPFPTPSNMVWIPAGTFTMGSPESEPGRLSSEGPQTQVAVSKGFCIGKFEVTQGEFLTVMGTNPSAFTGNPELPVDTVSWNDALAFCAALTARERNEQRLPAGYEYRLPTEAEWEYACRAGTTNAFHYGEAMRSGMANFNGVFEYPPCGEGIYSCENPVGTYLAATTKVGNYAPNAWGLHDMHGNAWEWTHDWFADSLPGGSITDPKGPDTGEVRVVRGGSWDENAWGCRSANRFYIFPDARSASIGFRVVLAAVEQ
jgi:formylglycine-generating enzyme required for sulfatase activity